MDNEVEEAPKRIRFNFWIPRDTYLYLEVLADRDGRSMSDIVREALRDYQLKHRPMSEEGNHG